MPKGDLGDFLKTSRPQSKGVSYRMLVLENLNWSAISSLSCYIIPYRLDSQDSQARAPLALGVI